MLPSLPPLSAALVNVEMDSDFTAYHACACARACVGGLPYEWIEGVWEQRDNQGPAFLQLDRLDPMQNQLCRVCDEPAAGFHFGAFTCEGCKSFFGRTCNNQSVIQECKNNYRCVVDKKNRTACKACRLRKCLMVGMSKSGSRYGRRSNWFKIHCLMQQATGQGSQPASSSPTPLSQVLVKEN